MSNQQQGDIMSNVSDEVSLVDPDSFEKSSAFIIKSESGNLFIGMMISIETLAMYSKFITPDIASLHFVSTVSNELVKMKPDYLAQIKAMYKGMDVTKYKYTCISVTDLLLARFYLRRYISCCDLFNDELSALISITNHKNLSKVKQRQEELEHISVSENPVIKIFTDIMPVSK